MLESLFTFACMCYVWHMLNFFDREKFYVKVFQNSGSKPRPQPRRRNENNLPVPSTLDISAERLKITKRTQLIFYARYYI